MTRPISRPFGLWIPPVESETARIRAPCSAMRLAAIEPALPKACQTTPAALGRAAPEVVLDPVAGVDLHAAVVQLHREMDGELATGLSQDPAQAGVQVELVGRAIELLLRHGPRVDGGGDDAFGGHWMFGT